MYGVWFILWLTTQAHVYRQQPVELYPVTNGDVWIAYVDIRPGVGIIWVR